MSKKQKTVTAQGILEADIDEKQKEEQTHSCGNSKESHMSVCRMPEAVWIWSIVESSHKIETQWRKQNGKGETSGKED